MKSDGVKGYVFFFYTPGPMHNHQAEGTSLATAPQGRPRGQMSRFREAQDPWHPETSGWQCDGRNCKVGSGATGPPTAADTTIFPLHLTVASRAPPPLPEGPWQPPSACQEPCTSSLSRV